jgi:hypothetical protein
MLEIYHRLLPGGILLGSKYRRTSISGTTFSGKSV